MNVDEALEQLACCVFECGDTSDDEALTLLADEVEQQHGRIQAVRDAWSKAQEDDLPQGFGWPGDLFDALEAL